MKELLQLLQNIAESYQLVHTHFIRRDVKDNFLFDLIEASKADFLVTGDKELLTHNPFRTATILTAADFELTFK